VLHSATCCCPLTTLALSCTHAECLVRIPPSWHGRGYCVCTAAQIVSQQELPIEMHAWPVSMSDMPYPSSHQALSPVSQQAAKPVTHWASLHERCCARIVRMYHAYLTLRNTRETQGSNQMHLVPSAAPTGKCLASACAANTAWQDISARLWCMLAHSGHRSIQTRVSQRHKCCSALPSLS